MSKVYAYCDRCSAIVPGHRDPFGPENIPDRNHYCTPANEPCPACGHEKELRSSCLNCEALERHVDFMAPWTDEGDDL